MGVRVIPAGKDTHPAAMYRVRQPHVAHVLKKIRDSRCPANRKLWLIVASTQCGHCEHLMHTLAAEYEVLNERLVGNNQRVLIVYEEPNALPEELRGLPVPNVRDLLAPREIAVGETAVLGQIMKRPEGEDGSTTTYLGGCGCGGGAGAGAGQEAADPELFGGSAARDSEYDFGGLPIADDIDDGSDDEGDDSDDESDSEGSIGDSTWDGLEEGGEGGEDSEGFDSDSD